MNKARSLLLFCLIFIVAFQHAPWRANAIKVKQKNGQTAE